MRKLLNRKIVDPDRKYAICHDQFTDYNDIVPDTGSQRNLVDMPADCRTV